MRGEQVFAAVRGDHRFDHLLLPRVACAVFASQAASVGAGVAAAQM
jgi:hypothetical protein